MSTLEKVCALLTLAAFAFGAGFYVSDLRWSARYADYKRAEAEATAAQQSKFDEERKLLEARASSIRTQLADSLASSDELRKSVSVWKSRAKTAESRLAVSCLELVERERRARQTGEAIIRYCVSALPGGQERTGQDTDGQVAAPTK
jgi:hypothetical protein